MIAGPRKKAAQGGKYAPPDFCMACGSPFPWLSRQGLLYLLENRILSGNLDPAEELVVREQLEALADPDLDDEEQERRWRVIADAVPEFWTGSGMKDIVVQVMSQSIRHVLKIE